MDCQCQFANRCPVHQDGQRCIRKDNPTLVLQCDTWHQLAEHNNCQTDFRVLEESKVRTLQDAGCD